MPEQADVLTVFAPEESTWNVQGMSAVKWTLGSWATIIGTGLGICWITDWKGYRVMPVMRKDRKFDH